MFVTRGPAQLDIVDSEVPPAAGSAEAAVFLVEGAVAIFIP
jgi:hypothetical protein